MATWIKARKCDLIALAAELEVEVSEEDTVKRIVKKIMDATDYDEFLTNSQIANIERDRLDAKEEIEREREATEREKERAHEIEKLRISQISDTISVASSQSEREPRIILKNVIPKFESGKSDIALYLNLFQRQATRAKIDRSEWVTNLLGLLPADIAEIILREPTESSEDFEYIKEKLLERFRLSPEDFRMKFVTTQRPEDKSWKDFQFEITNYLDEWLNGIKVTNFEQLRDLMITDQIKRKVPAEVREHFIDAWGNIITPTELSRKLDAYEAVRKGARKPASSKNYSNDGKTVEKPKFKEWPKSEPKESEGSLNWRIKGDTETRDEIFEKRKDRSCFRCGSTSHLMYNCTESPTKSDKIERVNHIANQGKLDETFAPYLSRGLINGKERDILRDTGSSVDAISARYVNTDELSGKKVWVRQALENKLKCLPIIEIELELAEIGIIRTKAAVVDRDVDMPHYIMGNKTQTLIDNVKLKPEYVGAVITRQQKRNASRTPPTPLWSTQNASERNARLEIKSPMEERENKSIPVNAEGRFLPPSTEESRHDRLARLSRETLVADQSSDERLEIIQRKPEYVKSCDPRKKIGKTISTRRLPESNWLRNKLKVGGCKL